MKKTILISLLFILAVGFVSSCKKAGCTNPKAKNYDASAKVDDATCEICDTTVSNNSVNESFTYDYYSTLHYGESVCKTSIAYFNFTYTGNSCKKYGFDNNYHCVRTYKMSNIRDFKMKIYGAVYNNFGLYRYIDFELAPGEEYIVYSDTDCITSSSFNITNITYP